MNIINDHAKNADEVLGLIKNAVINHCGQYVKNAIVIEYYYNTYKHLFLKEPDKLNELHKFLENTFPSKCPPIGTGFVGYKILKTKKIICRIPKDVAFDKNVPEGLYVSNECVPALAELYIPEDAKRSSAFGNKCRCNHCVVKRITVVDDGKLRNIQSALSPIVNHKNVINYTVGEDIFVDNFDDDRWNECSSGIHFFTELDNAINYTVNVMVYDTTLSSKDADKFMSWFQENKYE